MLRVLRWYLAGLYYAKQDDGITKPYSPVLGETYRCSWPVAAHEQQRVAELVFLAEQVSVDPPRT